MQLVRFDRAADLDQLTGCSGLVPLRAADFVGDRGDAHWALLDGDRLAARCSLWWTATPLHSHHRLGVIGHYAACDGVAGGKLLDSACAALSATECTFAIGPMDGSTWRQYRFVTEKGIEPPFFLEPDHPEDWPDHFTESGFLSIASYQSTVNDDLARDDPRAAAAERRLTERGLVIRPFNRDRSDEELRKLHCVALAAFRAAPWYQPLDAQEFVARYSPLIPLVHPDLVLIAERGDHVVGFVFAVPDWLQHRRAGAVDTIIIKTVAVHPGRGQAGLGRLLAWRCEQRAAAAGYRRAIHALMAQRGTSINISGGFTRPIRRYTLFGRQLP
jgi:hypothetical protein